ncbi:MAG: hypothetical protein ACFFAO_00140 [Candidatus Hermodarchaeota archaeon]
MSAVCNSKSCFCWNGCDDHLHECIERSKFVKETRTKLVKNKFKKKFKLKT